MVKKTGSLVVYSFIAMQFMFLHSCKNSFERIEKPIELTECIINNKNGEVASFDSEVEFTIPKPFKVIYYDADSSDYHLFLITWEKLYNCLYNDDTSNILTLISDNFCIRGLSDLDSTYCFSKSKFSRIVSHYLEKEVDGYYNKSSLFKIFSEKSICTVTPNWIRYRDFTFVRKDSLSEWRLNFIYSSYTE